MQGVMINERPAGNEIALKGNIGNYKGVMLCNRPSEAQEMKNQDRMINKKFISRVENIEQIGLNPIKKNFPPIYKRSVIKEILYRHKKYIKELGKRKNVEKIEKQKELEEMMKRDSSIKKRAAEARKTLTQIKTNVDNFEGTGVEKIPDVHQTNVEENVPKPQPLTEKNIKQLEENNIQVENKLEESHKDVKSKRKIPAWAKTEKMVEEEKEEEVDNLINFAYELDYEKYINDLEFKNALNILKERVDKIKEDTNWRDNYNENINQNEREKVQEQEQEKLNEISNEKQEEGRKSHVSEKSHKSHISKAKSIISNAEVAQGDKGDKLEDRPEWDKSTKEKNQVATVEDKVASQIADEILKSSNTFKKVHSKASVRRILEREAKKRLIEPKIVKIEEHKKLTSLDPSQLPYLHRNESV